MPTFAADWPEFALHLLHRQGGGPANPLPGGVQEETVTKVLAEPEHMARLLELARVRHLDYPYAQVHPERLFEVLPDQPLLRHWALAAMPTETRDAVASRSPRYRGDDGVWLEPFGPPDWFGAWWTEELAEKLAYPRPIPGRLPENRPLAGLWRYPPEAVECILGAFGLHSLAAALIGLGKDELLPRLYSLPDDERERTVELIKGRDVPEPSLWKPRLVEIEESDLPAAVWSRRLGLMRLIEQGRREGQDDEVRRLLLRLCPDTTRGLEAMPGSEYSDADWGRDLGAEIERLVEASAIPKPDRRAVT